jgi:hypothetical protein
MREIVMIAATAVITALVTIWSMHAFGTNAPGTATANRASMNILQMMRNTKNLPEESFPAH